MTVEELDIIDFIGVDKTTGMVTLTISDHLDWVDPDSHLRKLQDKLNCYLRFCESGELCESYPDAKGRKVHFSIAAKYPFPAEGMSFFAKAKAAIENAGFGLELAGTWGAAGPT